MVGRIPVSKEQHFEQPTLSRRAIVRLASADQRIKLIHEITYHSGRKCECGAKHWFFGFAYLKGTVDVVNGITVECQECGIAFAKVFDPPESMEMKVIKMERGVVSHD